GIVGVAHQQRAKDVGTADDFVVENALVLRKLVVVTAQFVQRHYGHVGRAIRVMHRGPVDGPAVFPDRQPVGNGERLTVAHDHAVDAVVGHPGGHPGVDAHAGEADLVARAFGVLVGQRRQLLLVRAPTHLRGGRAFLTEAFYAPGVDEFIYLFRLVGDLGVALAAMDYFNAKRHGQAIELLPVDELAQLVGGLALDLPVLDGAVADVQQALLREMRDEAGVGAVLDYRCGTGLGPFGRHAAEIHLAPVER